MNLKEEMIRNAFCYYEAVPHEKAIEIAEKYAIEMCKKQSLFNAFYYIEKAVELGLTDEQIQIISYHIKNAPLATEEE